MIEIGGIGDHIPLIEVMPRWCMMAERMSTCNVPTWNNRYDVLGEGCLIAKETAWGSHGSQFHETIVGNRLMIFDGLKNWKRARAFLPTGKTGVW